MSFIAITREVSASINGCELSFHPRHPIDVRKATVQHQAYQDCLAGLGATIVALPAEPDLPDAVFVEDAAVVFDEIAVITNMGAPSRRSEAKSVADALARYRELKFVSEPATLDGGDVLCAGRSVFVGLSQRTNREGIEQLKRILEPYGYRVQAVPMRGCLHLKSACSYLGRNTMLVHRPWIDAEPLHAFHLLEVPNEEPAAANVLLLEEVIIMPASFPQTRALLEAHGFRVGSVDISELQKAEGAVTCCSLLVKN